MQNKANLKMTQMFVTNELTRYYNRKDTWCRRKNKPKTNPMVCYKETQFALLQYANFTRIGYLKGRTE